MAPEAPPVEATPLPVVDGQALRETVIEILSNGSYPGVLHGPSPVAAENPAPWQAFIDLFWQYWPHMAALGLVLLVAIMVIHRLSIGSKVDPSLSTPMKGRPTPENYPEHGSELGAHRRLLRRAAWWIASRRGLNMRTLSNQDLARHLPEDEAQLYTEILEACEPVYYGEGEGEDISALEAALGQRGRG